MCSLVRWFFGLLLVLPSGVVMMLFFLFLIGFSLSFDFGIHCIVCCFSGKSLCIYCIMFVVFLSILSLYLHRCVVVLRLNRTYCLEVLVGIVGMMRLEVYLKWLSCVALCMVFVEMVVLVVRCVVLLFVLAVVVSGCLVLLI